MAKYICKICGYEGSGRRHKSGSGQLELLTWLILPPLGAFYSIWRRVGNKRDCPMCEMPTVVDMESDEGWLAKRRADIELGIVKLEIEENKAESFGNERPAEKIETKKPANPEQF